MARISSESVVLPATEKEPELGTRAILRTYEVEIPESLLAESKAELTEKTGYQENKFSPGSGSRIQEYPHTAGLLEILATDILEPSFTDLSFIRASGSNDHMYAYNLHFDQRYVGYSQERGIQGSFWRPSKKLEIWRQVINLNEKPRHLQLIDAPLAELEMQGIDIYEERPMGKHLYGQEGNPDEIHAINLVWNIPAKMSRVITLPAYDGKNLPVLEFWSSRVLHAGITSREGQFMAAAGKWVSQYNREGWGKHGILH